jgi:PAS domain S-box-containing protein
VTKAPRAGQVLIVDDNVTLVASLQAVLAHAAGLGLPGVARFEVATASRGAEALALAASRGVDVAIVDVKLPDTSGVDLIAPLKEACPFCEVVLITGFASMDAALAALRSGAFAFVLKSFRPEELIAAVEQALTKVSLKREREELERRYRAVVQLTDVLAIAIDSQNAVALFNRKAAQLRGIDAASAIGASFLETCIPEIDRGRLRDAIAEARRGARVRDVETGFLVTAAEKTGPAGPPHRVRWHLSSAVHAPAGQAGGDGDLVYGIGIDVTERLLLEKRAADAEALSAMGTLALNLAHEIRNPLNAAVLQLHLLGKDLGKLELSDAVRETLHRRTGIVGDEISRLNRLLTEFLELARPRGIAREPVHVAGLLDDVLDLERATADGAGVRIERDYAPDGCVAMGDREKLKQVALNLVVNAIEAMKGGGTLSLRLFGEGGRVVMSFGDTGAGIDPDVLESVFDPFFTTKEGGTGLGLSIVRKIVDQHGGRISIESERGKGTRVRVEIPSR